MSNLRKFAAILLLFVMVFSQKQTLAQFYNGSQLTFGKNRVQYNEHFWTFYRFDQFDTYFYTNGKPLAVYTAKFAEKNIAAIEKKLDITLSTKIQFVIFNTLGELKQSNIGLISNEQYNVGGTTHIVGSKVFIYFDGNHRKFDQQILAGITQVLINQMMYGEHLTSKVKNTTLLNLPDWYIQGLVAYVSEGWNTETDNTVKDAILSHKFEKFSQLEGVDATMAGHSIWNFISEKYGENVIPNILYMTKVSKSVENGFLFVLGSSYKKLIMDWLDFYDKRYYDSDKERVKPAEVSLLKKVKKSRVYSKIKISPDGKYAAFTTNEIGQYKVWIYDFEKKKAKKILKSENKLDEKTDFSFPVLSWNPAGNFLTIITEKKGKMIMSYYTPETKKFDKSRLFDFEKILSFNYSPNGKMFVFSGVQKGQSDIFVYNLASHGYEQITKDVWDDLNPCFIKNGSEIVFSSNRLNDTIRFDNETIINSTSPTTDLFLYDFLHKKTILKRITKTPLANESFPAEYDDSHITFLSDMNGINNSYIAKFDSAISYVDTTVHYRYFTDYFASTDYSRSIIEQDVNTKAGKTANIIFDNGKYKMFVNDLVDSKTIPPLSLSNTDYIKDLIKIKAKEKADSSINKQIKDLINKNEAKDSTKIKHKKITSTFSTNETKADTNKIDINNYTFGKKKKINENNPELIKSDTTIAKSTIATVPTFQSYNAKQRNYDVEYSIDKLVLRADFSFLNSSYQPFFGGNQPVFINPPFNGLIKVGVTDLLEDYRITGGVGLSLDLDNNEYVLSYENLKHRLDKQIVFHRQSILDLNGYPFIQHQIHELLYLVKWPFSDVLALKGTASYRNDRATFLSVDMNTLLEPDRYANWAGLKGELVFDNTREKGMNLYFGSRFKIFAEVYQNINDSKTLYVLGFDYRKYTKIHKTFIWANRIAASTSFGDQKLVYYMGGVDNWLFPKFNSNINIAQDQNYAYQTLATNMRGFTQNIRNGNSFAVINSELRMPIIKYLLNRPIKSEFFRNFQIVGFGDIGTAWTGTDPYSDKNALYTQVISQGPMTVTVIKQIDPIVGGCGFGLRSKILGYFVRADWAWGVEDGYLQKRIFYLSFGLDF
ncbi:MAG: PD40 domain-containing protein [Bacteroidetes bacterium]|nr:PD40 domain-containing protein [Bacteroidota bacterium]